MFEDRCWGEDNGWDLPGPSLDAICGFLGIPFEEEMLRPYDEGRMIHRAAPDEAL